MDNSQTEHNNTTPTHLLAAIRTKSQTMASAVVSTERSELRAGLPASLFIASASNSGPTRKSHHIRCSLLVDLPLAPPTSDPSGPELSLLSTITSPSHACP